MATFQRIAQFTDRVLDRLRDKRAFAIDDDNAIGGGFESLHNHRYAVLVTYRRNGEPVPSPVWFGLDEEGKAYLKTAAHAGKVKRVRHDNRVLMAPSTIRGKPVGLAIRGIGRVLPRREWAHAEETLAAAYGPARRVWERVLGGSEEAAVYIEITPRRPPVRDPGRGVV